MFGPHRLTALAAFVVALPAFAQVQDTAPFYAVVSSDKAPLRCNDGSTFYKVAELPKDIIVIVDGEGQGWSRVHYPAGTPAFIRAEEVGVSGETATLTAASKLKAANIASGYDGSYKTLFSTPLPVGTTLRVIEPAKDVTGAIAGYRVIAPAGSRGFVESRMLRKASDAEVSAYRSKPGTSLAALPTGGATPAATPTAPATPPTTDATAARPQGTPATPEGPAATPPDQPGAAPVEITQKTDPTATPAGANGTEPIVPSTQATPPAERRAVGSVQKLETIFQSVWKQPVLSAEVDELISEFDRAIEATPADNEARRRALEARREALVIRRQYRDTMRRQDEDRAKLDQQRTSISSQLEEIARTRYYTIIGQLQPSLVYNGTELPQMFRVVSVGSTSPRTLGYLKATPEIDLTTMLGQVVGVIGDAQLDRSLQLNIISPVHVDVLRSIPASTTPATAQPPTTPPGGN